MRNTCLIASVLLMATFLGAIDNATTRARRKRAAGMFPDGVLIVHALSRLDIAADGYRQDPYFYYLTGLENTFGAYWRSRVNRESHGFFCLTILPFRRVAFRPKYCPVRMPRSVWASIML
jgi:hypothetical protein